MVIEELLLASKTLPNRIKTSFDEMLQEAHVVRLPMQYNTIDVKSIVDSYIHHLPPFSEHKKNEFPDAFVLKSLEAWCKEHHERCLILSEDVDMRTYQSDYLIHKEIRDYLTELVNKIKDQEELIHAQELGYTEMKLSSQVKDFINDWVYKQLNNELLYFRLLQIQDISDYRIDSDFNIEFQDDNEIVGTFDDSYSHEVSVDIEAKVVVDHPDFETAYYDNEDDRYYFVDYKESRLSIMIYTVLEYTTDKDGEDPEAIELNYGDALSREDLEFSIDSKVDRYDDDNIDPEY